MSKKPSQNSDLSFAHQTAQNCVKQAIGIWFCTELAFRHSQTVLDVTSDKKVTVMDAITAGLNNLREAVADGKRIPQDVKAELAEITGANVILTKCGVDGTSAHDAAVELGAGLLAMVDVGLSKSSAFYRPGFESLSKDEQQAVTIFCKVQKWSYREVRGLVKKIEREYLVACRNRSGKQSEPTRADTGEPDSGQTPTKKTPKTGSGQDAGGAEEEGCVWYSSAELGAFCGISERTARRWLREDRTLTMYDEVGQRYKLSREEVTMRKEATAKKRAERQKRAESK